MLTPSSRRRALAMLAREIQRFHALQHRPWWRRSALRPCRGRLLRLAERLGYGTLQIVTLP